MHPRLNDMMVFWEKFVIFREKSEDPIDKIYEIVMTKIDIRCEICFPFLLTNQDIVRHVRNLHFDIIDGGNSNYITGKYRGFENPIL